MPLTPLSDFKGPPYRPKIPVIAGLGLVALLDATSLPLKWVGVITPSGSYVIASGIQQASWVLVVVVVVAALAIRLAIAAPVTWVRCLFVALDFFVPLGMYLEYIDNLGRAEFVHDHAISRPWVLSRAGRHCSAHRLDRARMARAGRLDPQDPASHRLTPIRSERGTRPRAAACRGRAATCR